MNISLAYSVEVLVVVGSIALVCSGIYQHAYQRGFDAGEAGGLGLSDDDLKTIYWLSTNGFTRLLLIGQKRDWGGFQTEEDAEKAHYALDRLEHHLPRDEVSDASFNRMSDIVMFWPKGPLSPAQQLRKQQLLKDET